MEEFQAIRAVFEVISPRPAPSMESLLEFVNFRTSSARGYYREYKDGVTLLESRARKRFGSGFTALEKRSKEEILRGVLARRISLTQESKVPISMRKIQTAFQLLFSRAEARFYKFVFLDLLRFYWSSSAGWAAIGYHSYPGVPDDPRAYTLRPAHQSITTP